MRSGLGVVDVIARTGYQALVQNWIAVVKCVKRLCSLQSFMVDYIVLHDYIRVIVFILLENVYCVK